MTISSTFDTDAEGWTSTGAAITHDPLGWVSSAEGGSGVWNYVAPAAYSGDLESYYGGTISFDLVQPTQSSQFNDEDIFLTGGGHTIVIDAGPNPGTSFTSYTVDLELGGGWRVNSLNGAIASEQVIREVLANLTGFEIRGEFVSGTSGDASSLDNVVWEMGDVDVPVPGPRIESTFDTGLDGWSFIADVQTFTWQPTGGNSGGYAEAVDFASGQIWYWVAPSAYLGDKSAFYDGTLSFDLQQSPYVGTLDYDDIVLTGGGLTIVLEIAPPGTDWTSYSFTLSTSDDWRVGSQSGAVATEAEIRQVLANLESLHIRGEYISGGDTGGLDNVIMQASTGAARYTDATFASFIESYATLSAALAAATAGEGIGVAGDPAEAGPLNVAVDGLTIDADGPYSQDFVLTGGAVDLALGGTADMGILGTGAANTLAGNDGANALNGGNGNDTMTGGGGSDTMLGGFGEDNLDGGDGNDTVRGNNGNDTATGGAGDDSLGGGNGNDDLDGGTQQDIVSGGNGFDILRGGQGNDTVKGGNQGDVAFGDGGADDIMGGRGKDILQGGNGDDTLNGGRNDDRISGEGGSDRFFFAGVFGDDTITDFDALDAAERIDLRLVSTITDFADLAANHMSQDNADVLIDDGAGNSIRLQNVALGDLDAGDFIF